MGRAPRRARGSRRTSAPRPCPAAIRACRARPYGPAHRRWRCGAARDRTRPVRGAAEATGRDSRRGGRPVPPAIGWQRHQNVAEHRGPETEHAVAQVGIGCGLPQPLDPRSRRQPVDWRASAHGHPATARHLRCRARAHRAVHAATLRHRQRRSPRRQGRRATRKRLPARRGRPHSRSGPALPDSPASGWQRGDPRAVCCKRTSAATRSATMAMRSAPGGWPRP